MATYTRATVSYSRISKSRTATSQAPTVLPLAGTAGRSTQLGAVSGTDRAPNFPSYHDAPHPGGSSSQRCAHTPQDACRTSPSSHPSLADLRRSTLHNLWPAESREHTPGSSTLRCPAWSQNTCASSCGRRRDRRVPHSPVYMWSGICRRRNSCYAPGRRRPARLRCELVLRSRVTVREPTGRPCAREVTSMYNQQRSYAEDEREPRARERTPPSGKILSSSGLSRVSC